MKFRAERNEFAEAVAWVTRTTSSRDQLAGLWGVLLEVDDARLTCHATDRETDAEVFVPVQVQERGTAMLPGRLLAQLVTKLPDAPVEMMSDLDRVTLRCGRAQFGVRALAVDNFPPPHQPVADAVRGVMKTDTFVRLVGQVGRAAATDSAKPTLTGVYLEATGSELIAAATDSYRLAVRRVSWDQGVEARALVPARELTEAARSAGEVGAEVTMVFETRQITFLFSDRRLSTTLLEGTFPDYRQLVPEGHDTQVVVDRLALIEALQRVSVLVLGQPNTPVTLTFAAESVDLTVTNQEFGEATESLPAEIDGPDLTISFNPSYLLSGLDAVHGEQVVIGVRDGLKPAVLRAHSSEQADDFLYLLMPMRVN